MRYRIAGIDVHKKMLAVVVADVAGTGEYSFERRKFGATPEQLKQLAAWLMEQEVQEAVMESTAQYWRPVWETLERYWQPACRSREEAGPEAGNLHLAQAQSNRGQRGRKNDFRDAERLVKRLMAHELVLSFVPDPGATSVKEMATLSWTRLTMRLRLWSVVANAHASQTATYARAGARTQPSGVAAGTGAYQVVQHGFGSVGGEWTADAGSSGRRGDRPGGAGSSG
jgi:hypothetical protein